MIQFDLQNKIKFTRGIHLHQEMVHEFQQTATNVTLITSSDTLFLTSGRMTINHT
jgi:hypothetical protein